MTMADEGSVTRCIGKIKGGDGDAVQELWERYHRRLAGLARAQLRGTPRRAADEEDVVVDAMDSLFRGAAGGRFPRLHDRTDLWQLLVVITSRKAIDRVNHDRRQKRGGGTVAGESALQGPGGAGGPGAGIEQIVAEEPTPEFAAQLAEEYQRLLDGLGDDVLRSVAVWKVEGYTNDEIAAKLGGVVTRTVERKLGEIRERWSKLNGVEGRNDG